VSPLRPSSADEKPDVLLKQFFQQHGYVRVANETRKEQLGQKYKKGYEVRLVVKTQSELAHIRQLLHQIGFKAGKPFQKHSRIVQPIYGQSAVEWFSSTTLSEGKGARRKHTTIQQAKVGARATNV
jgi:hypothetical protein